MPFRLTAALLAALFLLCSPAARADVRLPRLISDGMVLQRDTDLEIWGYADPGERVTVTFRDLRLRAEADADGRWAVALPPQAAGGPYLLTVEGKNAVTVNDILVGEVWLASGQSNMELSMGNVRKTYPEEIAAATNPRIREFGVPKKFYFDGPRDTLDGGGWRAADPESVLRFSAVAYFFAREINATYDVPVGIVNATLGGSRTESWMSEEALRPFPDLLDEALLYRDTAYRAGVERNDRERIGNWHRRTTALDPAYATGTTPWSADGYDDGDWATTSVPGFWNIDTADVQNGAVWYRRDFTVPEATAGADARLLLGNLVDADSTWINGTLVGTMGSQYVPRDYAVPAGTLRAGANNITVRVVSPAGRGGFVPDKTYGLVAGGDTLDLSGTWKYRPGGLQGPLRGPTFIQWKATGLYNGMIAPLLPYAFRGVLWYQGESNSGRSVQHRTLFPALIESWRTAFDAPELPFLYVQLPNYGTPREEPGPSGWAEFRESQEMALDVPHTGMATTIDVGEWNDIHPVNKLDVGKRLALLAERDVYGDAEVTASGPVFREATVDGNGLRLRFDERGGGLVDRDGEGLRHFTVAGEDHRFYTADARIDGDEVVVRSNAVAEPKFVRYAWSDAPEDVDFFNAAGLPARPFRSDAPAGAADATVSSPDGSLTVAVNGEDATYTVLRGDSVILSRSHLGLTREDADFSNGLRLLGVEPVREVTDHYTTHNAKKSSVDYRANEVRWHFAAADGQPLDVVFRVSDDGVAFRYIFPDSTAEAKRILAEATTFNFRAGTRAWIQQKTEPQTGFEHTNPSYEAHYHTDVAAGTPAPGPAGWIYPALFRSGDTWLLLTEADLGRTYAGTGLAQYADDGEYGVSFPQAPEVFVDGTPTLLPESTLPWATPWRIITIGDLATVMESTLGTDLAAPAVPMDSSFLQMGKAAWSWVIEKDAATVFSVQQDYIDFAADMHWQYCLIDANWDQTIGYDSVAILADYARERDVELLLWYNSAGSWNTVPFTPKDKLLTHESRAAEFGRLRDMGIRGVKIDFFGGDGQSMINYYYDILEDAADYGLLVNFHGATLPRGLQRTYPNFVTAEAVHGYEMITFGQGTADRAPSHMVLCAMIRNAFDPMDFTPMNLYRIPNIERATTAAFELATAVAFLSGVQHYAETPEGMTHVPEYVRAFLRELPSYWDDVRFVDGYPAERYVVARRSGERWYVSAMNATDGDHAFDLDLSWLAGKEGTLIGTGATAGDGEPSFREEPVRVGADGRLSVTAGSKDGFVIVFD